MMTNGTYALIYSVYGLAFFSMGLALLLEGWRVDDLHLRQALRALTAFGFVHGVHEWIEAYDRLMLLPGQEIFPEAWDIARFTLLLFSFLALAAFGMLLLPLGRNRLKMSLGVPIIMAAIWGGGLLFLRGIMPAGDDFVTMADVFLRYVLAIPASLLAVAGLVAQQHAFRQAGLGDFDRNCLYAAITFAWYGPVGQVFVHASSLPPSNFINQDVFLRIFGFPVQLLRATAATFIAIFVIRLLRSFDVETRRRLAEWQEARVEEAHRREELRGELLQRVVTAQEAERQRIARELHDATGQALTAIGLGLSSVLGNCRRQKPEQLEHRIHELLELNSKTMDELRHIITDLRPSHLDDLGLASALRWYANDLRQRVSFEIRIEIQGEEKPLDPTVSTALFRVTQEALTNILKHARAHTAWIRLRYASQDVTLEVEDDGEGIEAATPTVPGRSTWGLLGMRERAELLGGRFDFTTKPGTGALVRVEIPYQRLTGKTSEASQNLKSLKNESTS